MAKLVEEFMEMKKRIKEDIEKQSGKVKKVKDRQKEKELVLEP